MWSTARASTSAPTSRNPTTDKPKGLPATTGGKPLLLSVRALRSYSPESTACAATRASSAESAARAAAAARSHCASVYFANVVRT